MMRVLHQPGKACGDFVLWHGHTEGRNCGQNPGHIVCGPLPALLPTAGSAGRRCPACPRRARASPGTTLPAAILPIIAGFASQRPGVQAFASHPQTPGLRENSPIPQ